MKMNRKYQKMQEIPLPLRQSTENLDYENPKRYGI